jgi:hypothetical protein
MNACANNLRCIAAAKKKWALQLHKATTDVPTVEDLLPFTGAKDREGEVFFPRCPSEGTYTIGL